MSRCEDFVDRLYDEDVRRTLGQGAAPPADLRSHVSACPACAGLWAEEAGDAEWLARALVEPAPAGLEQRTLEAMRRALPPQPQPSLEWAAPTLWAVSGAALAACGVLLAGPALPSAWQPAVVLGAACAAFAAELTLQGLDATTA